MKEEFDVEYPLAEVTAAIGFFFVLMLEQLVTSYCIAKNHKDSTSKSTQSNLPVLTNNEPDVGAKQVQVDILERRDLYTFFINLVLEQVALNNQS